MSTIQKLRVGRTPLIEIDGVLAKAEFYNPTGSIKDRMAKWIIDKALTEGRLKKGDTIVEASSGNTGISLALLAKKYHLKLIVVMPKNMSQERKNLIKYYGAQLLEVEENDFSGAVDLRDSIVRNLNAFTTDQFNNPENVLCHYHTTGQEILKQVGRSKISAIVAGTGTGGTLIGIRKALIEKFPNLDTVAVEPYESAVMNGGKPGTHLIQGIGDGFIPPLVDMNEIDYAFVIKSEDALQKTKSINQKGDYYVGISSGANLLAAEQYMLNYEPDGLVITILPDRGDRYTSMW